MKDILERRRAALADARLELERCEDCAALSLVPRGFCAACGSTRIAPAAISGRGRIAAITTIHRAPTPEYRERVPYAIALVDLEDGVRLMGHAADGLAVGAEVVARVHSVGARDLLLFDPAEGPQS